MKKVTDFMRTNSGVLLIILIAGAGFLLTSCAHTEVVKTCLTGHTYGFWGGLWHGFIAPFDMIGMLIYDDVAVYATNTNGAWYAFGFLLGSGGWGFFGGKTFRKKQS